MSSNESDRVSAPPSQSGTPQTASRMVGTPSQTPKTPLFTSPLTLDIFTPNIQLILQAFDDDDDEDEDAVPPLLSDYEQVPPITNFVKAGIIHCAENTYEGMGKKTTPLEDELLEMAPCDVNVDYVLKQMALRPGSSYLLAGGLGNSGKTLETLKKAVEEYTSKQHGAAKWVAQQEDLLKQHKLDTASTRTKIETTKQSIYGLQQEKERLQKQISQQYAQLDYLQSVEEQQNGRAVAINTARENGVSSYNNCAKVVAVTDVLSRSFEYIKTEHDKKEENANIISNLPFVHFYRPSQLGAVYGVSDYDTAANIPAKRLTNLIKAAHVLGYQYSSACKDKVVGGWPTNPMINGPRLARLLAFCKLCGIEYPPELEHSASEKMTAKRKRKRERKRELELTEEEESKLKAEVWEHALPEDIATAHNMPGDDWQNLYKLTYKRTKTSAGRGGEGSD